MRVNLENLADSASSEIPGFVQELLRLLPGLKKHTCSKGYDGGFVERLNTGTYLAHIIEHVALELSTLSGIEVSFGKSRYAGEFGLYDIATRFTNEESMRECLRQAFQIIEDIILKKEIKIKEVLETIKTVTRKNALGPSATALLEAAKKRKIPYRQLGEHSLIELGHGKNRKRIQTAVSDLTSLISVELAQDKNLTKILLQDNFIPVPQGFIFEDETELEMKLQTISAPYVVKPLDSNHGNGVCIGLKTKDEVLASLQLAKAFSNKLLVEEMCAGLDYRALVVNGKLVAVAERQPPTVIGDGISAVETLLEKLNADPRRGDGHENVMTKVIVDEIVRKCLSEQGKSLNSVPQMNETVILRRNANLSSGGSAIDVTDKVHPEIKIACERAARIIGLDICGIDFIHTQATKPLNEGFKIIEINAGPGLRMHLAPSEGAARPVAEAIMKMIYPLPQDGRIPITAITGTNGKTTVTRLIHKILSQNKKSCVGMTTTDGIWIGNERIASGDMTGPQSAQIVLSDSKVDAAVLEVARGGILRAGLGYDWADVGVITNISADHLGQDGLETIDDLLWVKSLVAERVRDGGTIVLNADAPEVLKLKENSRINKTEKNYFLFSTQENNKEIISHLANGGDACWVENKTVFVQRKDLKFKICLLKDILFTIQGTAKFQVANVLAAVAATVAQDVPVAEIIQGLVSFNSNAENTGRLNIFKFRQGNVIIDYGHNTEAFACCGDLVQQLDYRKKTAVIGLPGDRSDDLIELAAAELADHFDHFIVREDADLRGRKPGELANLITRAIRQKRPRAQIDVELKEENAILHALEHIEKDELVFIFYDVWELVQRTVFSYEPQPVDTLPIKDKTTEVSFTSHEVDSNENQNAHFN